jgi:hypothetical protein
MTRQLISTNRQPLLRHLTGSNVCLATEIAERLDAESPLGSCVWSILEGEIAENGSAGQGSAKTIHSEANQQ